MASKLVAARMASWSGLRSVIARASRPGVLSGAVSEELVGTTFDAHDRVLSARRLWIAFAAEVVGSVAVDAGARHAVIARSSSLLPTGVVGASGDFPVGAVVDVVDGDGHTFARGITSVACSTLQAVMGRHTSDLPAGVVHEVVHRDDLVVIDRS